MSDNPSFKALWIAHLAVQVRDGSNVLTQLDFNRFRYAGIPQTKHIHAGKAKSANRDDLALQLYRVITQAEELAEATKHSLFVIARQHLSYSDSYNLSPFTKQSISSQLRHLSNRQRRGEIKDTTETRHRSELSTLLQLLGLPHKSWLPAIPTSGKSQQQPAKGYSDQDLKKLLPFLRSLFKQLHAQFVAEPERHLMASKNNATMTFNWQGKAYPIYAGITKLFCAATYLLAYYTWSNSKVLYDLKRPHTVNHSLSEDWYQMPAFKRRAFKTITVEIGANDRLEIPKYALQFFDKLLTAARLCNPDPEAYLLGSACRGQVKPMSGSTLNGFKRVWLAKHFPLTDSQGERLWPVAQRFRATGSQLALAHQGLMKTAHLLDNTPNVVRASYSTGNPHENTQMLRDAAQTLEQSARDRQGVEAAKQAVRQNQQVEVLAYEAYLAKATPPSRTAHGGYCKQPFGEKAEAFNRRVRKHHLQTEGERLACADLLACFSCEHQVLVESEDDLWCLLSFRESIEESLYMHLDKTHFQKNFGSVLERIDARLKLINNKVLRVAERKLSVQGRHPLWSDAASVSII